MLDLNRFDVTRVHVQLYHRCGMGTGAASVGVRAWELRQQREERGAVREEHEEEMTPSAPVRRGAAVRG